MALYLTLGLCALAAAALVYHYDLYDKEPLPLLALAVALGAAAMSLAGRAEAWILSPADTSRPVVLAAVAAGVEELMKLLAVVAIARLFPRPFNDPIDGLIYGSMAGLGMAVEESVAILRHLRAGGLLPPAELVRISGHLVMGGIAGLPIGMARMQLPRWRIALVGCFGAAAGLHFAWDWNVLATAVGSARQSAVGALVMLSGLVVYGALVAKASGWSRRVFAPSAAPGLWGWPFRR